MSKPVVKFKVRLSRKTLIRIISQQLTMSWRHLPKSREECLLRAKDYLLDVMAGDLKKLRQLYEEFAETPTPVAPAERLIQDHWREARLSGPNYLDEATKIVDKFFPELKPENE
jgi:hypothetical protein